MKYPFEPKSTSKLKQGQFWCFKLRDGRYSASVVLARTTGQNGKIDTRMLWAGLLDWVGPEPASAAELISPRLLERGAIHVRCIQMYGQRILGEIPRDFAGIPAEMPFSLAATPGWPVLGMAVMLYRAEDLWGDKQWVAEERKRQTDALDRNPQLKKVTIDV